MTKEDIEEWKSQIVISNSIKMGIHENIETMKWTFNVSSEGTVPNGS